MRETCARVLAAALMTGAIAAVVGMSALFGIPTEPDGRIAAPPSSSQRAVSIRVAPAAPGRPRIQPTEAAHQRLVPVRATAVTQRLVIIPTNQPRGLAAVRRQPTPATPAAPAARVVTPPAQAPQAPAPSPGAQPPAEGDTADDDHDDHGHAYGHDKQHGNGQQKHEE